MVGKSLIPKYSILTDCRTRQGPLALLGAMGVYQKVIGRDVIKEVNGVAVDTRQNEPVTAHIFKYTTQISFDPDLKRWYFQFISIS
jgi:Chitin synthase